MTVFNPKQHDSPQNMCYRGECAPERALAAAVVQRAVFDALGHVPSQHRSSTGREAMIASARSWIQSDAALGWIALITPGDRDPCDVRAAIVQRMEAV